MPERMILVRLKLPASLIDALVLYGSGILEELNNQARHQTSKAIEQKRESDAWFKENKRKFWEQAPDALKRYQSIRSNYDSAQDTYKAVANQMGLHPIAVPMLLKHQRKVNKAEQIKAAKKLKVRGKSNAEIAKKLNVTVRTVQRLLKEASDA